MTDIKDLIAKINQLPDEAEIITQDAPIRYADITATDLKALAQRLEQAEGIARDAVGLIAVTVAEDKEITPSVRAGFVSIALHLNERLAELDK